MIKNSKFHHHYHSNKIGRDFIVGDLQGIYTQLMNALELLNFNKETDRLFCVGDLIDRGPESLECAQLIYEPWFKTTTGNHEIMMWQSIIYQNSNYIRCWIENGGYWFKEEDSTLLRDIAHKFMNLPYVISVGEGKERFNIVHAELIRNSDDFSLLTSDEDIDKWNYTIKDMNDMVWGRTIIGTRTESMSWKLKNQEPPSFEFQTDELSLTYCGHSIVPERPVRIQRQIYLDTGCVNGILPKNVNYQDRYPLTLACPQEQMFYLYRTSNRFKKLLKYPYSKMKHYT